MYGDDCYTYFPDDSSLDLNDTEKLLTAVTQIKTVGNKFFKDGDYIEATIRYKKALRYLDACTAINDDSDEAKQRNELKTQCLLNR